MVEPWMSGSLTDVHPVPRALLHSFEQVLLDLRHWTEELSADQIWACPMGLGAIGFHLRHIAGSTDRLYTYARGEALTEGQLQAMRAEQEPGASCEELLRAIEAVFQRVGDEVRSIDPAMLTEAREVGRKKLPSNVTGLLIHIAEHNLRHVGEVIITSKVVRAENQRPG
ncbi:MAG: DinB family protein [Bryobacterales bacterium]|nr:DinB family protein [Bryobacterales bacterium]